MTDLRETILEAMDSVHDMDVTFEDYADAIVRALPGAIKPLEWHKSHMPSWDGDYHAVPTGYIVRCADENGYKWIGASGSAYGYEHSPEAAQAAAEAHYRAGIMAAFRT